MHEISSTLLAMKIAPVRAAMREPGVSIEAAIGISSHSAKARMNMPMPHLKRHPAGEAAGGGEEGQVCAASGVAVQAGAASGRHRA
ncbi:hypothetical protein G6F22_021608 [Rhizopus arrhizus]|nr:hypothetical protein G6F22_021608 [Rhizopus arrhizus]